MKASLHYLHTSPRKVRLVADLIRGMDATRAEHELTRMLKRSARPLLTLLRSAVANARRDVPEEKQNLYIAKILVNSGPTAKRTMPRARGRGALIRKRTSHVELELGIKKTQTFRHQNSK